MTLMVLAALVAIFGSAAAVAESVAGAANGASPDSIETAVDWQSLVDLVESLPDDVDDETKQLIADLLAESGGFASIRDDALARDGSSDNELQPLPLPFITLSVLSRAEGVLEGVAGSGSGPGGSQTGGWRDFDARTYLRVRGDVAGGITFGGAIERDPGEPDAFDHSAWYVRWGTVIAGDVVTEWGQRLLAGGPGFGAPGGPELTDRLRGYDGAAESVSRRGVAASARFGAFETSVLATRTRLDAALDEEGHVTTIRTSGTHVTEGERLGRDAMRESALGVRLVRSFGGSTVRGRAAADGVPGDGAWRAGVSALRIQYDRTLAPADPLRSRFGFAGKALELYGLDASGGGESLRWGVEIATHAPREHAAFITIEGRRGRGRVLLGADAVTRGFYSPLGESPPGASSGGNCLSSWLRLSYSTRGSWSAWCRGRVTGHPWRTYNDPLPPRSASLAAGGAVRLGRTTRFTAEASIRGETGTSAKPHMTESTADRRERFSLVVGRDRRWKLWLARSARTKDGSGCGRRTGVGCSLVSVLSARGDRLDLGVTLVSSDGSAPTLYAGEPGLPGAFGLRSLKGSGAGWYIRARKALPAGTLVTVRMSRSTTGEELTLGLAVEAGTTGR